MSSFLIKYPEKRKKYPINPEMREFPIMKFGTNAPKLATKEFDIKSPTTPQVKNRKIHPCPSSNLLISTLERQILEPQLGREEGKQEYLI